MRKTYAKELYRSGATLKELQEALDHDRPETTLLYLLDNYDELIKEALHRQRQEETFKKSKGYEALKTKL